MKIHAFIQAIICKDDKHLVQETWHWIYFSDSSAQYGEVQVPDVG
jgi:hydroxyacyl-ACP dehydratase HTD2-like protein with hotdog domain